MLVVLADELVNSITKRCLRENFKRLLSKEFLDKGVDADTI
jgi:hypothetical protein